MKERVLVTTALEESWPEHKQSILFLGEWCRLYSRKKRWKNLDAVVLPYHWDDRDQLYKDYKFLLEIYEVLLQELTTELNKIHQVNFKPRYWRILIGPWLMTFIAIIFDRWSCLNKAFSTYEIKETLVIEENDLSNIPNDMEHFSLLQEEDFWNHSIYSYLLKLFHLPKITKVDKLKNKRHRKSSFSLVVNRRSKFVSYLAKISMLFKSNNNYFFMKSYLTPFNFLKLNIKLFQFPVFFRTEKINEIKPNKKFRQWKLQNINSENSFLKILKELIPMQIPTCYLEGYKDLREKPSKLGWPRNPKLIWTSNSFHLDDVFKQWVGEKSEMKIPYIIGQHGGNYGQALFSFTEYHELETSDYFLSWGWTSLNRKVIPVGFLKRKMLKKRNLSKNKLLLIISSYPRYSGSILSMPISKQVIDYFEDQINFFSSLPISVTKNSVIRLYPNDYEWSQRERWTDIFPESVIDNCDKDFNIALNNSKIVIAGWNTTTYLESLAANIPTVIFWNPKYFELRDGAKEYFEQLEEVGIFHKNADSAANHVRNIWESIDEWWSQPEVVEAKNNFMSQYIDSNKRVINKLATTLKSF